MEGLGKDGPPYRLGGDDNLCGVLEAHLSGEEMVGFREQSRRNLAGGSNQNSLPVEPLLGPCLSQGAARTATVLLTPHLHCMR